MTRRARERFEQRAWAGIRRDTVERLSLHGRCIDECIEGLRQELSERLESRSLWAALKLGYTYETLGRDDFEVAQTFFNSLVRKTFPHVGVDPAIDFVAGDFPLPYRSWEMASARTYAVREVADAVVEKILGNTGFGVRFRDLSADAAAAGAR
ncbi:MAG: bifunctional isocitrate dehydrogenase kinase/phosphatase, partial [Acidobacteriota bacterium]|nr:bifunctional isocitrate dehydrogenase kinase/phosphatase [Acidobacteriota bacterium]